MARRVFFSFHFDEDIWRVNQVRMSNVVAGPDRAGFYDHSEYLEAKKKGHAEIKRMIKEKLTGTTVTVVLIGHQTASRPWVQYEIEQSVKQHNGLLGILIHKLKRPQNHFELFDPTGLGGGLADILSAFYTPQVPAVPWGVEFPVYEWDKNLPRFAEQIEAAGKRSDALRAQVVSAQVAALQRRW